MKRTFADSRMIESVPDPSPSPAEQLEAKESPPAENPFGIATRLLHALASLTKTEAWAAIFMLTRPEEPIEMVARAAMCSPSTIRRALDRLKGTLAGGAPPPGVGSSKTTKKGQRTRRGAKGKQTNAKGKK